MQNRWSDFINFRVLGPFSSARQFYAINERAKQVGFTERKSECTNRQRQDFI